MKETIIELEKVLLPNKVVLFRLLSSLEEFEKKLFRIVSCENKPLAVIPITIRSEEQDIFMEDFFYNQIFYSPLTGNKIKFNILNVIDETNAAKERQVDIFESCLENIPLFKLDIAINDMENKKVQEFDEE